MELSIVVPVHNEEANVEPLVQEIAGMLAGAGLAAEMIFVDDGSEDQTLRELARLQAGFPALRVFRHRVCCGQSMALHTGISRARGEIIATLDGDGQNDPADIPRLVGHWKQQAAEGQEVLVAGFRKHRQDTGWRRFSSRLANAVRGFLLKDQTPDSGCGLKVFSRTLFLKMPCFDHMHRFLPALARRAGAGILSVEVNHRPRVHGYSKYGTWQRLWVGIWDLLGVFWLQHRGHLPEVTVLSETPSPDNYNQP
jgi:dolichol-phosphate mannosyltransferase